MDEGHQDHLIIPKGRAHAIWKWQLQAAPEVVVALCQAWTEEAETRGVATSYDPHHSDTACTCSYHFGLSFKDSVFGLLLSFWWEIEAESNEHCIEAYLMAGQDLEDASQIELNRDDLEEVLHRLDEIVASVEASLSNEPRLHWSLFCIEGPVYNPQTADSGSHRVFCTRLGPQGALLTPIALAHTGARPFQSYLGVLDLRLELIALMELLFNNPLKFAPIKRQGQEKVERPIFDSCPTEDQVSELIPGEIAAEGYPFGLGDITDVAAALISVVDSGRMRRPEHRQVTNAIFAFHDGLHSQAIAPTLAGIAFFASLASFTRQELCKGDVTCSKCGKVAQHPTTGEVNRVIAHLEAILGDLEWPKEDLRRLLKRFHTSHRSAFVHAAKLQFSATSAERADTPLYPAEHSSVHPDVLAHEALHTVWRVARLVLLKELSDWEPRLQDVYEKAKVDAKPTRMGPLSRIHLLWPMKPIRLAFPKPARYDRR